MVFQLLPSSFSVPSQFLPCSFPVPSYFTATSLPIIPAVILKKHTLYLVTPPIILAPKRKNVLLMPAGINDEITVPGWTQMVLQFLPSSLQVHS